MQGSFDFIRPWTKTSTDVKLSRTRNVTSLNTSLKTYWKRCTETQRLMHRFCRIRRRCNASWLILSRFDLQNGIRIECVITGPVLQWFTYDTTYFRIAFQKANRLARRLVHECEESEPPMRALEVNQSIRVVLLGHCPL